MLLLLLLLPASACLFLYFSLIMTIRFHALHTITLPLRSVGFKMRILTQLWNRTNGVFCSFSFSPSMLGYRFKLDCILLLVTRTTHRVQINWEKATKWKKKKKLYVYKHWVSLRTRVRIYKYRRMWQRIAGRQQAGSKQHSQFVHTTAREREKRARATRKEFFGVLCIWKRFLVNFVVEGSTQCCVLSISFETEAKQVAAWPHRCCSSTQKVQRVLFVCDMETKTNIILNFLTLWTTLCVIRPLLTTQIYFERCQHRTSKLFAVAKLHIEQTHRYTKWFFPFQKKKFNKFRHRKFVHIQHLLAKTHKHFSEHFVTKNSFKIKDIWQIFRYKLFLVHNIFSLDFVQFFR